MHHLIAASIGRLPLQIHRIMLLIFECQLFLKLVIIFSSAFMMRINFKCLFDLFDAIRNVVLFIGSVTMLTSVHALAIRASMKSWPNLIEILMHSKAYLNLRSLIHSMPSSRCSSRHSLSWMCRILL